MKLIKELQNGLIKLNTIDAVGGNVLAEMLEVRHIDLMRTIKKVMKYEEDRKSHYAKLHSEITHIEEEKDLKFDAVFKRWEYTNRRGRTYPTYIMNEDALYLVIANTQSRKAHDLKVWFKSEFNKMKIERTERESEKVKHLEMTDAVKVLQNLMIEEGSEKGARFLYSTVNSKIYKKATGKAKKRGSSENHDSFSVKETAIAEALRENVPNWIGEGLKKRLTSKAIREHLFDRIDSFNPVYIGHNTDDLLSDELQTQKKEK